MAWFKQQTGDNSPQASSTEQQKQAQHNHHQENTSAQALSEKPTVVRFPQTSTKGASVSITNSDCGDQGSKNLWQVYVLGAFLIGQWLWTKWNDRRANRRNDDGDES